MAIHTAQTVVSRLVLSLGVALASGAGFLSSSGCETADPSRAQPPARPNIVLIMADDLGFSDLGSYGSEIRTPHLDALAARGVRFTDFANTARCCPSRASLLTGKYAHAVGMGWMTAVDEGTEAYRGQLAADAVTIAEVLQDAGYVTALSGKWHLTVDGNYRGKGRDAAPNGSWPTERGFDRFYGTLSGGGGFYEPSALVDQETPITSDELPDDYYYTHATTDAALRFIDERDEGQPLFLYLAYYAPHRPLEAPADRVEPLKAMYEPGYDALRRARLDRLQESGIVPVSQPMPSAVRPAQPWDEWPERRRERWITEMATYAAMIEIMDDGIGEVVAALDARGELDNTVFFFLSDNGATDEGGDVSRLAADLSNTPFMLYKKRARAGGIRSPLIVAGLPTTAIGIARDPAHIIDLAPTILDITGVEPPADPAGAMHGTSLLPAITGEAELEPRDLFWEHEGNRAIRRGDWKAVATGIQGPWELYDLAADPFEQNDLAAESPARLAELTDAWTAWAAETGVLPIHHEGWYERIRKYEAIVPDQSGNAPRLGE